MSRATSRTGERGFSVIELIVAVTILGIIMTTIGTTFAVLARGMEETQERFTQSRGPKFGSVYWVADVAGAELVNPASQRCGTVGTPLVTLRWTDDRLASPQYATWVTEVLPTGNVELERLLCDGTALAIPKRTTIVAPHIATSGTAVRCDAGAGLAVCGTDATPARVVLEIQTADGRSFTIDANRRVR